MIWSHAGRRPAWPPAWLELAQKVGGSTALWQGQFGYRSKTTLSAKIRGRLAWTKGDIAILRALCEEHGLAFESLEVTGDH